LSIECDVVEFFTILPPSRDGASAVGNLTAVRELRERRDPHFAVARLFRVVCNPVPVRGQSEPASPKRHSGQQRNRFAVRQRHKDNRVYFWQTTRRDDGLSIFRPILRNLAMRGFEYLRFLAASDFLLKNTKSPSTARGKREAAAVGRPNGPVKAHGKSREGTR